MRSILFFALAALAIAAFAPKLYLGDGANAVATMPAAPQQQASGGPRTLTLSRDGNGHFHAQAVIDGRRAELLVDTGASLVTLRESDAARLGFRPARRDYTARIATANGMALGAPVSLNRVEIGGLVVHNVRALVLPDGALSQNLLGMSFLSRVRFEYRNGRLILEQP
jgi:aspartyl protease family protein